MLLKVSTGRIYFKQLAALLIIFLFIIVPSIVAQTEGQSTEAPDAKHEFNAFASGIRVNVSAGEVLYKRGPETAKVEQNLELLTGDNIVTGKDSRAELLLQPGNYLRLAQSTDCQILGTEYDRVRIDLKNGTLNLELTRVKGGAVTTYLGPFEQEYDLLRVFTPAGEVLIPEPGLYRIEVRDDGTTSVRVDNGQAFVVGQKVKEKQSVRVSGERVEFAKIDAKSYDTFDTWCRARSQELVEANHSLKKEAWWAASDRKPGTEPTVDLSREARLLESQFVVSAKLAAVTFIEPNVEVSEAESHWAESRRPTELKSGNHLRTSSHSHAELMLLPNIVLRLDGDSEIRIGDLSEDAISFKLLRGSAIIDATKFDRKDLPSLNFAGPANSFTVLDPGNYRIDVKNSLEVVTVRKGKVQLAERNLGSCKRIENGVEKDCGRRISDSFDLWSLSRGEGTIYDGRPTATYLLQIRDRRFKSTGFWYYHQRLGYCTFVPFFFQGFESPYGGDYSTVLSPKSITDSGPVWRDWRQFRRPIFSSPRP